MKKYASLTCAVMMSVITLCAQTPVPEPDTLREVKQTDPTTQTLPPEDINYTAGQIKITPEQLPAQVKQTLQSGTQYEGWEKAAVYKSETNDLFTIEISRADTTRIFQFDKMGRPAKE